MEGGESEEQGVGEVKMSGGGCDEGEGGEEKGGGDGEGGANEEMAGGVGE